MAVKRHQIYLLSGHLGTPATSTQMMDRSDSTTAFPTAVADPVMLDVSAWDKEKRLCSLSTRAWG